MKFEEPPPYEELQRLLEQALKKEAAAKRNRGLNIAKAENRPIMMIA